MSLTSAIRKNAASLVQAQNSYQLSALALNSTLLGLKLSGPPILNQNPPNWNDFVNAFASAKEDLNNWTNTVIPDLNTDPGDVQGLNEFITQVLSDALSEAQTLVNQPSDSQTLAALNSDLSQLSERFKRASDDVGEALSDLNDFQNTSLPDLISQLNAIANAAVVASDADQQLISALVAQINQQQQDIQNLQQQIADAGIGIGVTFVVVGLCLWAAWPVGTAAWFIAGVVALGVSAVGSIAIATDSEQIKADNAQIANLQQQMNSVTADVAALNCLTNQFNQFVQQVQAQSDNMQNLLTQWNTLASDVQAAINDINDAVENADSSSFAALQDDLKQASDAWNQAYTQAGSMVVNIQVNTAQLQMGMSAEQVQAALAKGQTMSLREYLAQAA